MKLKSLQKEFSIYDDNGEIIGIVSMTNSEDSDEVAINIGVQKNLTFNNVGEFDEFVQFIRDNAER